jgi:hypothetical protein
MRRRDAPTARRAYGDHLRPAVPRGLCFGCSCPGRAPVTGDLPHPPRRPGSKQHGRRKGTRVRAGRQGHERGRSGRAESERQGASLSGLDWAIAGKCLVLRLLYSHRARGTTIKKSAWSYARGRRPRSGQAGIRARPVSGPVSGRCPGPVEANSSRDRDNHANGLSRIRRIGNRPSDVWCVSSCVIESVRSRQGNDVCVCTGRLHGSRGYRNASKD